MGTQMSSICCNKKLEEQNLTEEYMERNITKDCKKTKSYNKNFTFMDVRRDMSITDVSAAVENPIESQLSPDQSSRKDYKINSQNYKSNRSNSEEKKTEFTINYDDGRVYVGETVRGIKHGKGKLTLPNAVVYEGEFYEDFYDGNGKLLLDDGSYFIGKFKNGMKNGYGVQYNKNEAQRFEGEWKDDMKEGQGKETYEDGSFYEGSFKRNKKHGRGKMWLSKGSFYEGDFFEDKIQGNGTFKWSDQQQYEGAWKDDCLHGFGKFSKDNKVYKGFFFKDKRHGYGAKFNENGNSILVGYWVNNNMEGLAISISTADIKEQLILMKKNTCSKILNKQEEIKSTKEGEDYKKLREFYSTYIDTKKPN